jgi:hypothetical protein
MQKAKDSFFAALRDRLSSVNCERTVVIDGQTRPGILVCENEVAGLDEKLNDTFCVKWGASTTVCESGKCPTAMDCSISYKSAGSVEQNGMDRGRMLAVMDNELACMLAPRCAQKMDFSSGGSVPVEGKVFWSHPEMGAIEETERFLRRTVTLKVLSYPEAQ